MRNILFICSKNQWRSPTGEKIFKNHAELNVRSAGTSASARKTVNAKDILWADIIFVMEEKHKSRLKAEFTKLVKYKDIQVLDIPDEYQYMDEELIDNMEQFVSAYLGFLDIEPT
ncbi:low molecular weight protein tyrosine phosphatase family protein [Colwellia polaris]|uniref:low molecular weight protein tyrosine phosphatase family protein n=1 Tax=Colwellia polaris TaxID=326537 RepID=UPI000A172A34|nr:phosphotyrosine protein phosphatase [Colwellia polaris]